MDNKEKIEFIKRKIQDDPNNAELLHDLASLYSESNLWDEAIHSYQKAIEKDCHQIKSYIELANLLFSLDMIDKAVELCQLGIDYNQESSVIYYLLEQLYEVLGEYELASQTLEDLINIDSGYNKAYEALGRLAILQNRFSEAEVWLKNLLEKDPENINAYIYLANIYRRNKDFVKSEELLEKAKKIDPKNLDIYNDLGLLYLEFNKFDKAKLQFEYVLSLDDNYIYAYDNLGVIYRKLKMYSEAEKVLMQSLSITLQAWTYNELALVYTEQGKYRDSIEASKKAIAVDPNYSYAYDNLGAVYRKLGYFEKAEESLKTSLEIKSDDSWTFNQLGLLNFENGKYLSAKANFLKSAELDVNHYWPRINLASCYLKEKDYEKADSYLDELETEFPDNSRIYMLKSKLKYMLDKNESALEQAQIALDKDGDDPLNYANLGFLFRESEEYMEAERYFNLAINLPRPKDSSVFLEYAILSIMMNQYDKALYNCIKAQEIDDLNYNIYCIISIIENSSDVETRLVDYIKRAERDFPDSKEVFMSYACSFIELGLPEESEKYFKQALEEYKDYVDAQYGIAQASYLMKDWEKSLHYAFHNTDNNENRELASYSNALVALNYRQQSDFEKYEEYKANAIRLNPTIKKELFQKYKIRQGLKYKDRSNFFRDLSEIF